MLLLLAKFHEAILEAGRAAAPKESIMVCAIFACSPPKRRTSYSTHIPTATDVKEGPNQ